MDRRAQQLRIMRLQMRVLQQRQKIILAYLRYERNRNRRVRRWYQRPINSEREKRGEYHRIIQELRTADPARHYHYFRMSKDQFDEILNLVKDLIEHPPYHRFPISAEERLAVTLRLLASGANQVTVAQSFCLGYSTVNQIFKETVKALWTALGPLFVPPPTPELWKSNADNFAKLWHFPNCIGAIDGKHVMMQKPDGAASTHINYKGFHSIVLMAVVGPTYLFNFVDIGGYGKQSDGGTWANCLLGKALEQKNLAVPDPAYPPGGPDILPHVFVADAAFPMSDNLMRPYPGYGKSTMPREERIFNYRLSRARRVVENAFGILAQRWKILGRAVELERDTIIQAVFACIALHNFLTSASNRERDDLPMDIEGQEEPASDSTWELGAGESMKKVDFGNKNRSKDSAYLIQNKFRDYFVSPSGSVPWQESSTFGVLNIGGDSSETDSE